MALYLVSYDISEKDAAYKPLRDFFKRIGAVNILSSGWLVKREPGAANNLYDQIVALDVRPGRLLVQEVGADAAWDKLLITDDDFKTRLRSARDLNR